LKRFEDISEFYDPNRALAEEVGWIMNPEAHRMYLNFLLPRMAAHEVKSVIEFGCGSGILASLLPKEMSYLGVDRNSWFLEKARMRNGVANEKRLFQCFDARNVIGHECDLSMAWAFLKHFGLDEWDRMLAKVLSHGRFGAFNVQLAKTDFDNGEEFHHVFVTEEHLQKVLAAAGHEEIDRSVQETFTLPSGEECQAVALWTRRKPLDHQLDLKRENIALVPWENPEAKGVAIFEWDGQIILTVDGVGRNDLCRYSLRWNKEGDQMVPALYQDGKRLVVPWRFRCDLSSPGGGDVSA